ncbi:response regulator [bacterium]|nr:MAG: response regulator [bacterium]
MPVIMVVDDEKYVRESFGKILNKEGYDTKLAANGEEVLALLEEVPVDLILMDFKMPGMDGIEACRRIRGNNKTKSIPIIMVTAYPQERESAFKAGADDFVTKPADPKDVLIHIKAVLRIQELTKELIKAKAYLEDLRKEYNEW